MEFLKTIFGDKQLNYEQLVQAINAHNGDEANKESQIKIGNLGGGEYVAKGKFDSEIEKLTQQLSGKTTELQTANNLIADLQKATKGNEEMQVKFAEYQNQVATLQAQLQETKTKAALKVALLSEKAVDVDYLTYKVNEKLHGEGKSLELDENENIKGWEDLLSGLKTQFPSQFSKGSDSNQVNAIPLPEPDSNRPTVTNEDFEKMGYQSRLKLKQEQPAVYAELTGKNTN